MSIDWIVDARKRFEDRGRLAMMEEFLEEYQPSLDELDQRVTELATHQGLAAKLPRIVDAVKADPYSALPLMRHLAEQGEAALALHTLNVLREPFLAGTERAGTFIGYITELGELVDNPTNASIDPDMAVSTLCTLYGEAFERERDQASRVSRHPEAAPVQSQAPITE